MKTTINVAKASSKILLAQKSRSASKTIKHVAYSSFQLNYTMFRKKKSKHADRSVFVAGGRKHARLSFSHAKTTIGST